MSLDTFYSVVSGINFTLLGLWWVAVKDHPEIGRHNAAGRRLAYLVSLQFIIPGTVSLLSQIAPDVPALWRISFGVAGLGGAIGIMLLAEQLQRHTTASVLPNVLRFAAFPAYLLVTLVAVAPGLVREMSIGLTPLQVEAILLCLLVFLGVQEAWVVSMTPRRDATAAD